MSLCHFVNFNLEYMYFLKDAYFYLDLRRLVDIWSKQTIFSQYSSRNIKLRWNKPLLSIFWKNCNTEVVKKTNKFFRNLELCLIDKQLHSNFIYFSFIGQIHVYKTLVLSFHFQVENEIFHYRPTYFLYFYCPGELLNNYSSLKHF